MNVVIYTMKNCPECEKVKLVFKETGTSFEEKDLNVLLSENTDVDALTQLAMQDMSAPVIKIDNDFIDPSNLKEELLKR